MNEFIPLFIALVIAIIQIIWIAFYIWIRGFEEWLIEDLVIVGAMTASIGFLCYGGWNKLAWTTISPFLITVATIIYHGFFK